MLDVSKSSSLCCLTCRFINTPDVVGAVLRHPDARVRNMLKIGQCVSH